MVWSSLIGAQSVPAQTDRVDLLSLPTLKVSQGDFHVGTIVYDEPKWSIGISRGEMLQSMAIFGRSGSGKTNLVFHLLEELLKKGVAFLFLDWKQTARHLLPFLKRSIGVYTPGRSLSPLPFNPFMAPPGIDEGVYRNHLVDVISDAYDLGEGARSLIQRALADSPMGEKSIELDELIANLERAPESSRQAGWKVTALRALRSMKLAGWSSGETRSNEDFAARFFGGSNIIELDGLNHSSRKMLVPLLCQWLYQAALVSGTREQLRLVIVLEEAHHFLYGERQRSRESLLEMLLRQCREVGISFMIVDQHPHLISSAALGNSYVTVTLNLKDPADVSKAAAIAGIPSDQKSLLSTLPVGRGVLRLQDRWTEALLVQIPLVNVKKGDVTDDVLQGILGDGRSRTAPIRQNVGALGRVRRFPVMDDSFDERGAALIEDVLLYPEDGVKARYARLQIGGSTGHSLKQRLIEAGWLEAEVVPVGKSRKVMLRLTKAARDYLGANDARIDRESIAHSYWKHYYAKQLEQDGYQVQVEGPRNGGNADVVAVMNGERIAVEIETGKSDVLSNIKACLAARFTKVFVIAVTLRVLDDIEKRLAAAGLLIPERVLLIQAGNPI
jgi:hypothetical protein